MRIFLPGLSSESIILTVFPNCVNFPAAKSPAAPAPIIIKSECKELVFMLTIEMCVEIYNVKTV